MTKRTAEQTLRDEILRTERELEAARARARKAEDHVSDAEDLLAEAEKLVESARAKMLRSKMALEALIGDGLTLEDAIPSLALTDDELEADGATRFNREEKIAEAIGTDVGFVLEQAKPR